MLKNLRLKNFRSYENQKFVFHKGINAFIGDGLSGKTNIVRALKLLRFYRPISKFHKSKFAKENESLEVSVRTTDNNFIYLKKNDKEAIYKVKKDNEGIQTFKKFGKTVPRPVEKALNLQKINFQFQLDLPFVVTDSSGDVTKIINKITRIGLVDGWIKAINQDINSFQIIFKDSKKEYFLIKEKLKNYRHLYLFEPILVELKKLDSEKEKLEEKYYQIQSNLAEIKSAKIRIREFSKTFEAERLIEKALRLKKKIKVYEFEQNKLIDFIDSKNEVKRLRRKLKECKKMFFNKLKREEKCPFCLTKITRSMIKNIKDKIK